MEDNSYSFFDRELALGNLNSNPLSSSGATNGSYSSVRRGRGGLRIREGFAHVGSRVTPDPGDDWKEEDAQSSSGDDDDKGWHPRSKKKCGVRADSVMSTASSNTFKNQRKKPLKKATKITPARKTPQGIEEELAMVFPLAESTSVDEGDRMFMVAATQHLRPSDSGGFQRFLAHTSVAACVAFNTYATNDGANEYFDADESLQLMQAIRYAWQMCKPETRRSFEIAARKEAKKKQHADKRKIKSSLSMEEQARAEESEAVTSILNDDEKMDTEENEEGKKTSMDESACCSMPPTETPWTDGHGHSKHCPWKGGELRCPLCPADCENPLYAESFSELLTHVTVVHRQCHLHGCHECGRVFSSRAAMRAHSDCEAFTKYALGAMLAKQTVEEQYCVFLFVCGDCGLQLPIRSGLNSTTPLHQQQNQQRWIHFAKVMEYHNCSRMAATCIFFCEEPSSTLEKFTMQVQIKQPAPAPVDCERCGIESFSKPSEAEEHFLAQHTDALNICGKCGKMFGTELYYKEHLLCHVMGDSVEGAGEGVEPPQLALADWIEHTASMWPGVEESGHATVGAAKYAHTAVGGMLGALEKRDGNDTVEMVPLEHNTRYEKAVILRHMDLAALNAHGSDSESDADSLLLADRGESGRGRRAPPDLGYENMDYGDLEETSSEKAYRNKLASIFHSQKPACEYLRSPTARITTAVELKDEDSYAVSVALSRCGFADELSRLLTHSVHITADRTRFVDTLSNVLLTEKVFYCTVCHCIARGAAVATEHANACLRALYPQGVDVDMCDEMLLLYAPPSPPSAQLHCPHCSHRLCGIHALRRHLASKHALLSELLSGNTNVGLRQLTVEGVDGRRWLTRKTDSRLKIPSPSVLALARQAKPRVAAVPPLLTGQTSTHQPPVMLSVKKATAQKRAYAQRVPAPPPPEVERKWYRISNRNTKPMDGDRPPINRQHGVGLYHCSSCGASSDKLHIVVQHFSTKHCSVCEGCGAAFVNDKMRMLHATSSCSRILGARWPEAQFKCPVLNVGCGKTFTSSLIHAHIIRAHVEQIAVRSESDGGMILPSVGEVCLPAKKKVDVAVTAPRSIQMTPQVVTNQQEPVEKEERTNTSVHPQETVEWPSSVAKVWEAYEEPAIDDKRLVCQLCGLQHKSPVHLDKHYEKHVEFELWGDGCPCCPPGEQCAVRERDGLMGHLLKHAYDGMDRQSCYACCRRVGGDTLIAHVVYECPAHLVCPICGLSCSNATEMVSHRSSAHPDVWARLRCSECRTGFAHRQQFLDHSCKPTDLPHTCTVCEKALSFRAAALAHVEEAHFDGQQVACMACRQVFSKKTDLRQHRYTHIRAETTAGRPAKRQLVITNATLITQEPTEEDMRRATEMAEHKDVEQTVSGLVNGVCRAEEMEGRCEKAAADDQEDCFIVDDCAPPPAPSTSSHPATISNDSHTHTRVVLSLVPGVPVTVNIPVRPTSTAPRTASQWKRINVQGGGHIMARKVDTEKEAIHGRAAQRILDSQHIHMSVTAVDAMSDAEWKEVINCGDYSIRQLNALWAVRKRSSKGPSAKMEMIMHLPNHTKEKPLEKVVDQTSTGVDDDDCCIVQDVCSVRSSELAAEVRTEEGEATAAVGGTGQPGYVEEEEDAVLAQSSPHHSEHTIMEGDDEVMCTSVVNNGPGFAQWDVKRRAATLACDKCSKRFVTKASLSAHRSLEHQGDAGEDMCDEVFGYPFRLSVGYCCRNCCLVYESFNKYQAHRRAHAGNELIPCPLCSAAFYNTNQLPDHQLKHRKKELWYGCHVCQHYYTTDLHLLVHQAQEHGVIMMFFCKACGLCSLQLDNVTQHIDKCQPAAMRFSESLGAGRSRASVRAIGCVAANQMHFQPTDAASWNAIMSTCVQRGRAESSVAVVATECAHRSMLGVCSGKVSCASCHGLRQSAAYFAETREDQLVNDLHGGFRPNLNFPTLSVDSLLQLVMNQQRSIVCPKAMARPMGASSPLAVQQTMPRASVSLPSMPLLPGDTLPAARFTGGRVMLSNGQQVVSQTRVNVLRPAGTIVISGAAGKLQQAAMAAASGRQSPVQRAALGQRPVAPHSTAYATPNRAMMATEQPAAASQPTRPPPPPTTAPLVVELSDDDEVMDCTPTPSASSAPLRPSPPAVQSPGGDVENRKADVNGQQPTAVSAVAGVNEEREKTAAATGKGRPMETDASLFVIGGKCGVEKCGVALMSAAKAALHAQHNRLDLPFVCFACKAPTAWGGERELVRHFYDCHVSEEAARRGEDAASMRVVTVCIKCPVDGCQQQFTRIHQLRSHIIAVHTELPHKSCMCDMRFASEEAMKRHDKAHEEAEEATGGMDVKCCDLCGSTELWTERHSSGQMMSHLAMHGFMQYAMCRVCFSCFGDGDPEKVWQHFQTRHAVCVGGGGWRCEWCETESPTAHALKLHCFQHHMLRGMQCVERGQNALNVVGGPGLARYLGIQPPAK